METRLGRRALLTAGATLGVGALVAGCTSNSTDQTPSGNAAAPAGDNASPGRTVTIGFSAPAADHGWIGAITTNAKAQAKLYPDIRLNAVEGTNDVNQQISAVQSLIDQKVDVLVILPFDGKALTGIAQKAMAAGIPVINLDRIFETALAYRTWVGGDNYGMGVSAGTFIARRLKAAGKTSPVILEIAGIDNLQLTQDRSRGFKDALAANGLSLTDRQAADFTAAKGQEVAANLLQAHSKVDALWNHDDDQGIGVEAAIKQAGRDKEFFMVGGAGSRRVMDQIKADNGVVKATVLYSPSMSSSAISLARLIGQGRGMGDLVEKEVPTTVTTYSAVVTKDNVDRYLPVGFA
ncbi:sugar ABC transporter substrate-binding protein [Longispora fulva]|uniref:Ribose transport system substrate-binding protein n=1 Tax=Longispora fulva TaxID=619741 RepID=A0A8J7G5N3_9ACTN|nr:substrate-binding domain-containing protein [Longispora fulva]MBG6134118.1 ribose transport system substrate-binding protein [Longispora fulva]GIG62491.1 sugar ABC transporter substrate-binding protein [Longispora fulva]